MSYDIQLLSTVYLNGDDSILRDPLDPQMFSDVYRRAYERTLSLWQQHGTVPTEEMIRKDFPTLKFITPTEPVAWLITETRKAYLRYLTESVLMDAVTAWEDEKTFSAIDVLRSAVARVEGVETHPGTVRGVEVVTASDVRLEETVWLWQDRLPANGFTLLTGDPEIGKSTISLDLAASLTRGRLPGDFRRMPQDVLIVGNEDALAQVTVPRLKAAGADLRRVHIATGQVDDYGKTKKVSLTYVLENIAAFKMRYPDLAFVYIDGLAHALPQDANPNDYAVMMDIFFRLNQVFLDNDLAGLAVWHNNKKGEFTGSTGISAGVRTMLNVRKDPDATLEAPGGFIFVDKSNATNKGTTPVLRYRLNSTTVKSDNGLEINVPHVAWEEADMDVFALKDSLDAAGKDSGSTGAVGWLKDFLTDEGPTHRADLMEAGEEEGYDANAINYAARKLKVYKTKSSKDGKRSNVYSLQPITEEAA